MDYNEWAQEYFTQAKMIQKKIKKLEELITNYSLLLTNTVKTADKYRRFKLIKNLFRCIYNMFDILLTAFIAYKLHCRGVVVGITSFQGMAVCTYYVDIATLNIL